MISKAELVVWFIIGCVCVFFGQHAFYKKDRFYGYLLTILGIALIIASIVVGSKNA